MSTAAQEASLDFRNQSFYDADFSNRNLRKADFRGATLHNCNFDHSDLSYADFNGADCYKSSFVMAKLRCVNFAHANLCDTVMDPRDLFGTSVTIHCNTVQGVRMGRVWIAGWLQYLLMADIDPELKDKIKALAESQVGAERFKQLQRVFCTRDGI